MWLVLRVKSAVLVRIWAELVAPPLLNELSGRVVEGRFT